MPFREAIREALRTMWAQKLKSFFALVGVLIGVTFLVAVVAVVHGMNRYMVDQFANTVIGTNTFELLRFPTLSMEQTPAQVWQEWLRHPAITTADAAYLSSHLRTPARVARRCNGNGIAVRAGGRSARNAELVATDESYFRIRHYALAQGRAFTAYELRGGQPVIVIGHELAEKLLPGLDPIGKAVAIGGLPYRVIGVVAKQGTLFGFSLDRFAIMPFTAPGRRLLCGTPGTVSAVMIQTAGPADLQRAMNESETLLRGIRRLRPAQPNNFYFQTSEGALRTWDKIAGVLMLALPGLVAISLVVGGIVIMNIMLMAVAERTREIGIRKALGARRRDILAQLVVEAATLSTLGAVFGIMAGAVLALVIRTATPLPAVVAPWSVAVATILGVAVGCAAGVYPAARAARLDPIAALRAE